MDGKGLAVTTAGRHSSSEPALAAARQAGGNHHDALAPKRILKVHSESASESEPESLVCSAFESHPWECCWDCALLPGLCHRSTPFIQITKSASWSRMHIPRLSPKYECVPVYVLPTQSTRVRMCTYVPCKSSA